MRILILNYEFPPVGGGGGRVSAELAREFVVQARINRGRILLTESSLTVSEIAAALGYDDIYFFSRQFKAKTGVSPTAFREGKKGDAASEPPG